MKTKLLILALCAFAIAAPAQTMVEGKNPAGSAVTGNPIILGGVDADGKARPLKLVPNGDGTWSIAVVNADGTEIGGGGGLTNAELRASAISVTVTNHPGTINIGNWPGTQAVSLASLPALPAGTNIIGKVGIDQTTDGTTNRVNPQHLIASGAGSSYTVTTSSGTALAANSSRGDAVIVNYGTVGCFLSRSATAVAGQGIYLAPNGGSYNIDANNLYRGVITAITASGTTTLSVSEGQ